MRHALAQFDIAFRRGIVRARHRANARASGFTIIEVVLVLGIMAVLAGIAGARYQRSISRYRAESAARRLAADLELARAEARRTSVRQTVTLDLSAATYTVGTARRLDNRTGAYTVILKDEPYRSTIVSSPAAVNNISQISFDGFGNPDKGGTVTVESGEFQRTVLVDAVTGEVSVP